MNVKDMVQEINAALDYNPDLKQYTDSIVRTINRHYLQVSSQYQWLFMQEKKPVVLRADITPANVASKWTFERNSCIGRLPSTFEASITHIPPDVEGQYLVITTTNSSTDRVGVTTNVDKEYRIVRYINARCIIVDRPAYSEIGMDKDNLQTGESSSNFPTWRIEYRKYAMPRDSIEVLGVMDRGLKFSEDLTFAKFTNTANSDGVDFTSINWHESMEGRDVSRETVINSTTAPNRGRFMFLDSRKEEYLYLDRSDTGESFVSVEESYDHIDPPHAPYRADNYSLDNDNLGLSSFTSHIDHHLASLKRYLTMHEDIDIGTTNSFLSRGGLLLPGYIYQYCCTYEEFGNESAPSPVLEIEHESSLDDAGFAEHYGYFVINAGSTLVMRHEFTPFGAGTMIRDTVSGDITSKIGGGVVPTTEKASAEYRDTGRRIKIYRRVVKNKDSIYSHEDSNGQASLLQRRLSYILQRFKASTWASTVGKWKHIATTSDASKFVDQGLDLVLNTVYKGTGYLTYRELSSDDLDIPHNYDGESSTGNIDTFANYPVDRMGDPERVATLDETGPRQYLRFWKTPNSDQKVEARYHRRPRRLQADQDVPEWPPQYHHYLVYVSLRDICMQHSMLNHSQLYEKRAAEMLERMKNKYLTRTDRMHVRRGFDRSMADGERFGIPSKSS
jgi:hypothetical protein